MRIQRALIMSDQRGKKRRQEGGAGEGGGGSKKGKYYQSTSKATLPLGSRGVLISCVGGKEQFAARDSIRILTEYYDQLRSPLKLAAPAHTAKASVSDAIADEVAELKSSESQLFMYHKLGVYGLIYIAFDTIDVHPTPSEVVQAAARDVFKTKQCLSRLCIRFMPVDGVCHAALEDLSKLGQKLLPEHFPKEQAAAQATFGVLYEHRASDLLKRMDVINTMVDCIPQPPYKVELNNPKKTILVEVMKATAAISVIEDYKQLAKLNFRELSMMGDDSEDKPKTPKLEHVKQANAEATDNIDSPADGGKTHEAALSDKPTAAVESATVKSSTKDAEKSDTGPQTDI